MNLALDSVGGRDRAAPLFPVGILWNMDASLTELLASIGAIAIFVWAIKLYEGWAEDRRARENTPYARSVRRITETRAIGSKHLCFGSDSSGDHRIRGIYAVAGPGADRKGRASMLCAECAHEEGWPETMGLFGAPRTSGPPPNPPILLWPPPEPWVFATPAASPPVAKAPASDSGTGDADRFDPQAVIKPHVATGPGWECPIHGTADLVQLYSRGGRTYRACRSCAEFERGSGIDPVARIRCSSIEAGVACSNPAEKVRGSGWIATTDASKRGFCGEHRLRAEAEGNAYSGPIPARCIWTEQMSIVRSNDDDSPCSQIARWNVVWSGSDTTPGWQSPACDRHVGLLRSGRNPRGAISHHWAFIEEISPETRPKGRGLHWLTEADSTASWAVAYREGDATVPVHDLGGLVRHLEQKCGLDGDFAEVLRSFVGSERFLDAPKAVVDGLLNLIFGEVGAQALAEFSSAMQSEIDWYAGAAPKNAEDARKALISAFERPTMLAAATRALRFSVWRARPWGAPWSGHDEIVSAAAAVTEVSLHRSMCMGSCPVYTVTFRQGQASYVGEHYVDMIGPHEAELPVGLFDDLASAVMYVCLTAPARHDDEDMSRFTLDMSQTTMWMLKGKRRLDIARYRGVGAQTLRLVSELIDEAASELLWRGPMASGVPPPRPLTPGEQRHWTQRRYDGFPNAQLAVMLDSPALREALTGRERRVLQLSSGLADGRDWTSEQIGDELNLPAEKIAQIEAYAWELVRTSRTSSA